MNYGTSYNCNGCFNYGSKSSGLEYTIQNTNFATYSRTDSSTSNGEITAYAGNNSNNSNQFNYGSNYASLTSIINNPQISSAKSYDGIQIGQNNNYNSKQHYLTYLAGTNTHNQYNIIDPFLNKIRPTAQFIDEVEEIKEYVLQAFKATTNYEFPKDISIKLCDIDELKKIHESFGGKWENSIQGFSINKTREIFIKKSDLDKVMLVIGHEIGHVLSHVLPNKQDEEAKAFAFEMAWMKTIVKHNIANLKENIAVDFKPAENGLHDISFSFVKKVITAGKKALDIYFELIHGILKVN